jgi:hypothetical protein
MRGMRGMKMRDLTLRGMTLFLPGGFFDGMYVE